MKSLLMLSFFGFIFASYAEGKHKVYYLAIQEIIWDYAPSGLNLVTNNRLQDEPDSRIFTELYIGKKYKKAVYRRYTDGTFSTPMPHDPNLGFMGPTLRAEVGDAITVHLFNNATRPYSLHPHGVFYTKANEGAPYDDNSTRRDNADDEIPSQGRHTYEWEVLPEYGPGADDANCLTWAYHSHINSPKDINSGLIGALIVCRNGTYRDDETRTDVDHEFVAMFFVCDEANSWYFEENLRTVPNYEEIDWEAAEDIEEANRMHVVNAYVYANTPGYEVCQGDTISWHVLSMGTNRDLHPIQFQGQTVRKQHHRQDSLILIPATFSTLLMRANNPGRWYIACKLNSHFKEGMFAWMTVDSSCQNPHAPSPSASLTGNKRSYFIAIKEEFWNYAPSGMNRLQNTSLLDPDSDSQVFYSNGSNRIGGIYKKALFREYTDASFAEASSRSSELGFLGPVIAGEIGDTIEIRLKNYVSNRAFNIEPHGVYFHDNFAVSPLSERTFTWTLPEDVSPLPEDSNCLTYVYTSTVTYAADTNSGLVGPLLVCKKGTLKDELEKEHKFLFMTVFDENKSWYFNENIKLFTNPSEVDIHDGDFEESNLMHSINGRMFGNLEMTICSDKVTTLHVMSVGTDVDIHGIDLEGINVRTHGVNTGVVDVFPHTFQTLDIQPSFTGRGRMFCRTIDHTITGMSAIYNSVKCNSEKKTETSILNDFDGIPYYIAAKEIIWDYNPRGVNIKGESVDVEGNEGYLYSHHEPGQLIGRKYKKVVYFEYTDNTFTSQKSKPLHLGLLGPIIRGEVGETISIVFFNNASRPYNMFPWGAIDPTANNLDNNAVEPGEKKQYYWKIPESASPTPEQPACQSFVYLSNVDPAIDPIDGLIGPLLVCKKGVLSGSSSSNEPVLAEREFFLLFLTFDENLSHYYEDNLRLYLQSDVESFEVSDDFEESNKKKAINGLMWHVDDLTSYVGDLVRWHLIGWGNEEDYHSVHFHAHTYVHVSEGQYRGDVFDLYPGFIGTVEMRMIAVGNWLLHCHVFDHLSGGMQTTYSVLNSTSSTDNVPPSVPAVHYNKLATMITNMINNIISDFDANSSLNSDSNSNHQAGSNSSHV